MKINLRYHTFLIATLVNLFCCSTAIGQRSSEIENLPRLIDRILELRKDADVNAYTFTQETIRYDSLANPRDTVIWYEAVQYPDKFRIDFGSLDQGNMVLFKEDQAYRYRNFQLDTVYYAPREFLFMESGFAGYGSTTEILKRFEKLGFDPLKFYVREKENVFVIGAEPGDYTSKQFWVDRTHFYITRSIEVLNNGRKLDVHYSNFKNLNGFWIETDVTIYLNGKILQFEKYLNVETYVNFNPTFFDHSEPFEWHWFTE
ncbi:MAG: hypothetical protein AAFO99_09575 [Bacteroidota bacterium]